MANKKSNSQEDILSLWEPSNVWTTYDIGVSTALLCAGFELVGIDKSNPKKALFTFKREGSIDEIANDYFANKLNIKARSFADNLKALKNKLYGNQLMVLSDENISSFQKLYEECFGTAISKEDAYEQGIRLLKLVAAVYRPITYTELEAIQVWQAEFLRKQK